VVVHGRPPEPGTAVGVYQDSKRVASARVIATRVLEDEPLVPLTVAGPIRGGFPRDGDVSAPQGRRTRTQTGAVRGSQMKPLLCKGGLARARVACA
jgi:hypothetical protein